MVQKWNLPAFPINYNQDFAVIGDGESAGCHEYNPKVIKIFAINRSLRFIANMQNTVDVLTMYHHEEYMVDYLNHNYSMQTLNLIIIQLFDIRKHHLPSGDTANMLIHYLVQKMKSWGVRDKKIYLTGFDYSYKKDWKPQIKSLKYCQIMAEYNNIDIICTSENKRLPFLKHEEPLTKFLV
jgi:hypothetical protein